MESLVVFISAFQISTITQCAVHIAFNEFSSDTLILFDDFEGAEITEKIAKNMTRPVLMYYTADTFKYDENAAIVPVKNIIWIPKVKDFAKQITNVRNNIWWKSSSKLLIIIKENAKLDEIFSELWRKSRASNVVIVNENLEIFSWMPYQNQTCNENITPVKLSTCAETNHIFFFNKIPNEMNNCPFNVTSKQVWPFVGAVSETKPVTDGLEVVIMNTIAAKLRLNLRYVLIPDEVSFYPTPDEAVLTGVAAKLHNYETDIVFASMFQTSQHAAYADVLKIPHTSDQLIWFIPQPQEIPAYKNLYRAFEPDCWIAIFIATLLIISTEWLLEKTVENDQPEIGPQFLFGLAVNLNMSVPMPKSKLLKTFMIICFIYGLHVITAYQSSLISFLTRPVMDEPVASVEEGMARGLFVFLYEPHKPYIMKPGFPDQEIILRPGRHVFREQMHFDQMPTFQDRMVLGVKSTTFFYLTWLNIVDKNGQLLVRTLDKDVLFFFVTMLLVRGHPLKTKIDTALQQILESGLREKWMQDVMRKSRKVSGRIFSDNVSLTLSSLTGAFYILAIGLSLSMLLFAIELIKKRNSRLEKGSYPRKAERFFALNYLNRITD